MGRALLLAAAALIAASCGAAEPPGTATTVAASPQEHDVPEEGVTAGSSSGPSNPETGDAETAAGADAGADADGPTQGADAPLPAPDDEEIAAATAFVEALIADAQEHHPDPPLADRIDWGYVETVAQATGSVPHDATVDRGRWTRRMQAILHRTCHRLDRPLAVQPYAPGAADGSFDVPAPTTLVPASQSAARREARRAVARSLVVSLPCEMAGDHVDVLLRRAADGGPLLRGYRRVEAPRPHLVDHDPGTGGAGPADGGAHATPTRACAGETWGGWDGTPACRRASRRRVRPTDQRCRADADCVLLGTSCDPVAVATRAAARYRRWPAPCTPPGAGACAGPRDAVCDHGCCYPRLGLGGLR